MAVRLENIVTSGTFSLDGGTWDVDNNVYVLGDDTEVLVFDPSHDAQQVKDQVGDRKVKAIILTHAHDDHISEVKEFQELVGNPPTYLHEDDMVLWEKVYPGTKPDHFISDGDTFTIGDVELKALHTPGHSPGCVCFFFELDGKPILISGDTLFNGGPGATGRSYSDFDTIIESIKNKLFVLPGETVVYTGHGDSTSIGAEKPHLQEWIERGH